MKKEHNAIENVYFDYVRKTDKINEIRKQLKNERIEASKEFLKQHNYIVKKNPKKNDTPST